MRVVLAILAIDVLGTGLALPVLPTLVAGLADLPPARVSLVLGAAIASYSVMQFLCAPMLGALSDRYGRRPVLLAALVGIAASHWTVAFGAGLASLLIGRALAGAAAANVSTVMAYLADVSDGERRTHLYGSAGGVIAVGLVVGPVAGGWLASFDPYLPFALAGALAMLNAAYVALWLPESLPPARRRAFAWRRAQPVGSLRALFGTRAMRPYLLALVLAWAAYGVFQSCFVLANQARYGWSVIDASRALAALAVGMAVSQRFIVRRLTACIDNRTILALGYGCCALAYLCYCAASAPWLTYAGMMAQALGLVADPALRAELSRHASDRHQGELQGALASLVSLVGAIAPLVGSAALAAAVRTGCGAAAAGWPFALGVVAYAGALSALVRAPAGRGAVR
ncbi:MFS transporter [Burkholderia territorii]|nr:MFS transporter [Burkholderia territorii]